jgi:hypothetical protein
MEEKRKIRGNRFMWLDLMYLCPLAGIVWLSVIIYQLRRLKPDYEEYGEGRVYLLKYRNAKVLELINTIFVI